LEKTAVAGYRLRFRSGLLLAFTGLNYAMGAGTSRSVADDSLVFHNVAVFDGARSLRETDVIVSGSVITRVGAGLANTPGATMVDGKGKTLLPGFIDCHVHAFFPDHLKQAAIFGVTTELDMFTSHKFAAEMRAQQKSANGSASERADLLSAGTLATAPGGHGTEYGLSIPTLTSPAQADQFVADRVTEGSDYIKIIYDDGKEIGLPWPTIDRPTLQALVKAAHARKKLTVVHVIAREFARQALEDGADGLVHVFVDQPVDDAFVLLAGSKKAFVIPTLTVLQSTGGAGSGASLAENADLAPYLSPADVRALKSSFSAAKAESESPRASIPADTVRRLKAAGVSILAGTDAIYPGTAHGASLHRELELLVAAGLSPSEALAAATALPAAIFGLGDRGRMAAGLRADLVLVSGDPCTDVRATRAIVGVWKAGRVIDRQAYRTSVQKQFETLAKAKKIPAPKGSEQGLVSDFEGKSPTVNFGRGWSVSTDSLIGGKSKAEFKLVNGGARGSKGSLQISGTIDGKSQYRWAGAMFSPGATPMSPVNLSSKHKLAFWANGAGRPASVMIFFQANGYRPATRSFEIGKEWKQHKFDLTEFDGCDGSGIMGVFIGGTEPGPFSLQVDEVQFE
jgi:imidazolonepropionase-like amidohydrolase